MESGPNQWSTGQCHFHLPESRGRGVDQTPDCSSDDLHPISLGSELPGAAEEHVYFS